MAREQGLPSLDKIDTPILEAFGELTIFPKEDEENN
jgi:uncharacterized membrane protein YcaP (DUF421 family)